MKSAVAVDSATVVAAVGGREERGAGEEKRGRRTLGIFRVSLRN